MIKLYNTLTKQNETPTDKSFKKIDKSEFIVSIYSTSISKGDLKGNTNFDIVRVPDKVKTIGIGAFCDCSISKIYLPKGITYIGHGAFRGCSLMNVYYEGSEEDWAKINIGDFNESLFKACICYNHTEE